MERALRTSHDLLHWTACCGLAITLVALSPQALSQSSEPPVSKGDMELPATVVKEEKEPSPYQEPAPSKFSRTDVPLAETPRSGQVLTDRDIKDVGARDLRELYRHMTGVSTEAFMGQFFSRGFRTDHTIFVDGMRMGHSMEHYSPKLNNVDRVENHRGPSGVVMGPHENPGGALNVVSKRPQRNFDAGFGLTLGDWNTHGVTADIGGEVVKDGNWLYRVDALYDETDTFRDMKYVRDMSLIPSIAYIVDEDTRIDLQFNFYYSKKYGYRDRGLPFINNSLFEVPIERTYVEAGDKIDAGQFYVQAGVEHRFNKNLRGEFKTRYLVNDETIGYHEPNGIAADGRTLNRIYRHFSKDNEAITFTGNLTYDLESDFGNHTFVGGFDYSMETTGNRFRQARSAAVGGSVPSIDLYAPGYAAGNPASYVYDLSDNHTITERQLIGVFLQDYVNFNDKVYVMGSVRAEMFEDSSDVLNNLTGVRTVKEFDDTSVTFRAGAMYQVIDNVAVFGSYDTVYEPQNPANQDTSRGGPFDPTETNQYEIGLKTTWFEKRLDAGVTYYKINRTNVVQGVPGSTTGQLELLGEVESEGLEFQVSGEVYKDLRVIATYSVGDVEITKDANPANVGNKPNPQPPEQTGSLWVSYRPEQGFNGGAGMNFVDERRTFNAAHTIPSYVRWDANIGYTMDKLRLGLTMENVFDKVYFSGGYGGLTGGMPGNPRTFILTLDYRF